MLQPNELKKKVFSKAVRGYSQTEVDEYVEFLIDQYTLLYRQNAELEKKLHIVTAKYDEIADEEESIRSAVLKAQKLSEAMIGNARKKADDIVFTIEDRCKDVLADNEKRLDEQKEQLRLLRSMARDFRDKLYSQYLEHVKLIKEMQLPSPDMVDEDLINAKKMTEASMEGLSPRRQVMEASEISDSEGISDPLEHKPDFPLEETDHN